MAFDQILDKCGSFGRFQKILLLFYGINSFISAVHAYMQTIITFTPEHWCYHEKLANATIDEIRAAYAHTANPQCTLLEDVVNGIGVVKTGEKCNKWIFSYQDYRFESITKELQWVCHTSINSAIGQSAFYAGSMIGTIIFGIIADRFGRIPAIMATTLTGATGDCVTFFVKSLPTFVVARFIAGFSNDTDFYIFLILVFEYLTPEKRAFGLNVVMAIFYTAGTVLSPWLAVTVGTWRKYVVLVALPAPIVFLYPIILTESAHWHISRENYDSAIRCLKIVARINGREVDESEFVQLVDHFKQKQMEENKKHRHRNDSFFKMFLTPRLRKFASILLVLSILITPSLEVISRNVEGLGWSPFILFSFTSCMYFPAGFSMLFFQKYLGRRDTTIIFFLACFIIVGITGCLISNADIASNTGILATLLALGRYTVIVAFEAEVQYAAEILPGTVRTRGVTTTHVVGYMFSYSTTYIIYLGTLYKPGPSIIVSCSMLIATLLCLLLPETLNKELPENLEEGEKFALDEKWYYFSCFNKFRRTET